MINAKRESLITEIEGKECTFDYLTIYDDEPNGLFLARSDSHTKDMKIFLEYDGLTYMADIDGTVYITLSSLNTKFSQ